MSRFKVWTALVFQLLAFAVVLAAQLRWQNLHTDDWTLIALENEFRRAFASSSAKLLALFLVFAPVWAVFVARKNMLWGALPWLATTAWFVCTILFFLGKINTEPWLAWFLYAALMSLAGLLTVLLRVLRAPATPAEENTKS